MHQTQLDNEYSNDCGPASIVQLVWLLMGVRLSIRQVVTALNNANKFTSIAQMITGLKGYGVEAHYESAATWDWYARKLDDGIPVIALVDYSAYKDNPLRYEYAHFLTVIAYDATTVTVHDPLRRTGPTRIPLAEFVNSINRPSKYVGGFNRPNQAIYPVVAKPAPTPSVFSRILPRAVAIRETVYGAVA